MSYKYSALVMEAIPSNSSILNSTFFVGRKLANSLGNILEYSLAMTTSFNFNVSLTGQDVDQECNTTFSTVVWHLCQKTFFMLALLAF